MKRIYLLVLLCVGFVTATFAQRKPDLTVKQYWGKTTSVQLFAAGDKILASGGNGTSGATKYYFAWDITNAGATANDTIAHTDSMFLTVPALNTNIIFSPTLWNTGSFKNGMKQSETLSGLGIKDKPTSDLTPSDNFPVAKYPTFVESTTYDYDWCTTIRVSAGLASNPVLDANPGNDKTCATVKLTLWFTGVNSVIEGSGVMMFPNPAFNKVTLRYDFGVNATANVSVVDITGKTVYQQNLGSNITGMKDFQLDLASLAKGTYVLKLATNDKVVTERFDML